MVHNGNTSDFGVKQGWVGLQVSLAIYYWVITNENHIDIAEIGYRWNVKLQDVKSTNELRKTRGDDSESDRAHVRFSMCCREVCQPRAAKLPYFRANPKVQNIL